MTLKVINILGGPGIGKSTCGHELFSKMKRMDVRCEFVHEYAKDLTYEERYNTLTDDQIYVFAKQQHRLHVLVGKVDWAVTDTSIILGLVYGDRTTSYINSLDRLILDVFNLYDNYNFVLTRDTDKFQQYGRVHDLDQSRMLDKQIIEVMDNNNVPYTMIKSGESAPDAIIKHLNLNDKLI